MIIEVIVYTIIAIFIGISQVFFLVSQSAGIGGGPIINICLMLGLGYNAKDSMSITYIFLMGGALASIWKCKTLKNPKTGGPLIDYGLVLLTLPGTVSGSIFGSLLNHYISDFVITIMFSILLSYLTYNSYQKLQIIKRLQAIQTMTKPLIQQYQFKDVIDGGNYSTSQSSMRLKQILAYETSTIQVDKFKIVGQIFVYTLLILLFKGGDSYDSVLGFQKCGIGSWMCLALHFILTCLYTKSIAIRQYKLDTQKQSLGYVFQSSSDKMTQGKLNSCLFSGFLAGIVGGALGLGGAIILVPVWLNKGIDKLIAVSSSPPLIFFSALVAFTLGLLSEKYNSLMDIVFYLILSFTASYVVKQIVNYISQKYNLKAMIFILLIVTMISSLITLIPFQFHKYLQDSVQFMQFGSLC